MTSRRAQPADGPLRVAVDASIQCLSEPTGVERAQATLLQALARRPDACELHLLAPAELPERWRALPGVHGHGAAGGPIWFWRESVVPRRVRELGAQLFHSPVAALPMRLRCPLVATIHEAPWGEDDDAQGDTSAAHRLRLRLATGLAARLVCPSARTAAQIARLHPDVAPRVRVVPHGLDPELLARAAAAPERAAFLAGLALPDEPFVLGVGRLRAKKAWDVLLEALAVGHPDAPRRLVLAGPEGDAADALRERAARDDLAGRVRLLGHVDDAVLAGLYRHAAVLAHPARLEGFGLTPLEALACDTPVVVAAAGRVPEGTGEAAVVVADDAPGAWAAALGEACAGAGRGARARAAAELLATRTADAAADALLAVWRELTVKRVP